MTLNKELVSEMLKRRKKVEIKNVVKVNSKISTSRFKLIIEKTLNHIYNHSSYQTSI